MLLLKIWILILVVREFRDTSVDIFYRTSRIYRSILEETSD